MEEIDSLHSANLEWGCITVLANKICDLEEKIDGGWDALVNMVADIIEENSYEKDPATVFFIIYQFMFRLYFRIKANPVKREFNQISKTTIVGKEVYRVTNYNYKNFKWAHENGFISTISNDYIDIPADKLTTNQRRNFERRIGE